MKKKKFNPLQAAYRMPCDRRREKSGTGRPDDKSWEDLKLFYPKEFSTEYRTALERAYLTFLVDLTTPRDTAWYHRHAVDFNLQSDVNIRDIFRTWQ